MPSSDEIEAAPPAMAVAAEPEPPPLPPGLPPANESGFPMLPMFGMEVGELFNSLSASQSIFTIQTALREGVMTSGMAMLSPNASQAQVGTTLQTQRFGTLKAELISQGMLQTAVEGFAPLPFLNFNTQIAFAPNGALAGGVVQSMLMLPFGVSLMSANASGQMSMELITGASPTPTSQVMLGYHMWGFPGLRCGAKFAIEFQNMVFDKPELLTAMAEADGDVAASAEMPNLIGASAVRASARAADTHSPHSPHSPCARRAREGSR